MHGVLYFSFSQKSVFLKHPNIQYMFVLHSSFIQIFLTVGLGWVTGAVGLLGPQEVLSCSNLWRKVIL